MMQASLQEPPRRPGERMALNVNFGKVKLKLILSFWSFPEALITDLSNLREEKLTENQFYSILVKRSSIGLLLIESLWTEQV